MVAIGENIIEKLAGNSLRKNDNFSFPLFFDS